jgi:hypothetical protein
VSSIVCLAVSSIVDLAVFASHGVVCRAVIVCAFCELSRSSGRATIKGNFSLLYIFLSLFTQRIFLSLFFFFRLLLLYSVQRVFFPLYFNHLNGRFAPRIFLSSLLFFRLLFFFRLIMSHDEWVELLLLYFNILNT